MLVSHLPIEVPSRTRRTGSGGRLAGGSEYRAASGLARQWVLLSDAPGNHSVVGAFIVSSHYLHGARVLDDGMVGIHVGGLIMGLAPEP